MGDASRGGRRASVYVTSRSPHHSRGRVPLDSPNEWRDKNMRKRLTFVASLALVVLAATVLTGGSQAMTKRGKAPAAAAKSQATTVTLNGWQSSPAEEELLAKVVQAFEKTHPKID